MEPELRKKPIRYYEVDFLRFIAAFSVVLFHFTYRGYHADNMNPVEYPVLGSFFKYGYLGVNLFFIISGYVVLMSAQGKSLSQFFISRVTRLYPAYWAGCTFCFIIVRVFGPKVHAPGWSPWLDAPLKGYLYNMTMLQGFLGVADLDGVYWTLTYEIIFYFLISLIISFGWIKRLVPVLTIWLLYCILAGPQGNNSAFSFLFFPHSAPLFIGGMLLYMLQTKQEAKWKLYILLIIAYILSVRSTVIGVSGIEKMYNDDFSTVVVAGIITLSYIVMILIVYRKLNFGQSKLLAWAGALTYPIYLFHHNIGYVALQRLANKVDKHILLVGLLVVVLVISYLVHVFIERKFSKLLTYKMQALIGVS